jgi:hypothetical protein
MDKLLILSSTILKLQSPQSDDGKNKHKRMKNKPVFQSEGRILRFSPLRELFDALQEVFHSGVETTMPKYSAETQLTAVQFEHGGGIVQFCHL